MDPRVRRLLLTIVIMLIVGGVVFLPSLLGPSTPTDSNGSEQTTETGTDGATGSNNAGSANAETGEDSGGADDSQTGGAEENQPAQDPPAGETGATGTGEDTPELTGGDSILSGLRAVAPTEAVQTPTPIGSLDWRDAKFKVEFAATGAGIDRITFSDYWNTAQAKRRADRIKERIEAGEASLADLPAEERFVLIRGGTLNYRGRLSPFSPFAARALIINDLPLIDLNIRAWTETAPGSFVSEIHNDADQPIVRITRTYALNGGSYDLSLTQRLENLTDQELSVRWVQYGPSDLDQDPAKYFDGRRWRFGYRPDPQRYPTVVLGDAVILWRADVVDLVEEVRAGARIDLWPTQETIDEGYELSWLASTNRYFALAIHAKYDGTPPPDYSLTDVIERVAPNGDFPIGPNGEAQPPSVVFTELFSPVKTIPAGGSISLDLGMYAGPLDRGVLYNEQPYAALNMGALILYQMSAFCAFCTFQWLAHLLIAFLSFIEGYVLFDWGLAIIALVLVVRGMLHPLTKKAQISMQRFSRQMQKLKPEIDKLQKKYKDEPQKMQAEQMRLMREHGVNPLGCLGFLPMFLQTPIWIALYAMLFYAFELRHEPAFFGFFQLFGGWPFLADLAAADHFFWTFKEPHQFLLWNITGINLLPLLMGAIFFVQQKYMTPPQTNMSKEMESQQKIIRFMMVVMFPLFLYSAPSGLTLYIVTSSVFSILESRYIRRHIDELDLTAAPAKGGGKAGAKDAGKVNKKDPLARAWASAMERAEEKRKQKNVKNYKRRK